MLLIHMSGSATTIPSLYNTLLMVDFFKLKPHEKLHKGERSLLVVRGAKDLNHHIIREHEDTKDIMSIPTLGMEIKSASVILGASRM